MKEYVKRFFHRGMLFGGFGPIIAGIVYMIEYNINNIGYSNGNQMFIAIISTYILAFIQAGASVFNQIEEWSAAKSLLCHFTVIYLTYVICYLVNSWIPFDFRVLLVFTAAFAIGYIVIWLAVYISVKALSNKFNAKLGNKEPTGL